MIPEKEITPVYQGFFIWKRKMQNLFGKKKTATLTLKEDSNMATITNDKPTPEDELQTESSISAPLPKVKTPDLKDRLIQKLELKVGPTATAIGVQLSQNGLSGPFIDKIVNTYQPIILALNSMAMMKVISQPAASRARMKLKRAIAQDLITALNIKEI